MYADTSAFSGSSAGGATFLSFSDPTAGDVSDRLIVTIGEVYTASGTKGFEASDGINIFDDNGDNDLFSVYKKRSDGAIRAQIAGWSFDSSALYSPSGHIRMGSFTGVGDEIRISQDGAGSGGTNFIRMYQASVDNYGIEGINGNNTEFHLGKTNGNSNNEIAG